MCGPPKQAKKGSLLSISVVFCKFNVLMPRIQGIYKRNVHLLEDPLLYENFAWISCNAIYIGETSKQLTARIPKHVRKDKASHIFKHLNGRNRMRACSDACFFILNNVLTDLQGKLKEAMKISCRPQQIHQAYSSYSISYYQPRSPYY